MKWAQKITSLFVTRTILKIFFKLKVTGAKETEKIKSPLLIIGNHKSFLDTFALGAVLPLRTKLFPVRIMGEIRFFYNPVIEFLRKIGIIKIIYIIFGVFPAIKREGLDVALRKPIEIIKNKGVVFIHPEGKIYSGNEIGEFKIGAAALAIKTGVKILPIATSLKNKNYNIKFGPTFQLPSDMTYEQGAKEMREKIVGLYESI